MALSSARGEGRATGFVTQRRNTFMRPPDFMDTMFTARMALLRAEKDQDHE
jgi:hypothetical protein